MPVKGCTVGNDEGMLGAWRAHGGLMGWSGAGNAITSDRALCLAGHDAEVICMPCIRCVPRGVNSDAPFQRQPYFCLDAAAAVCCLHEPYRVQLVSGIGTDQNVAVMCCPCRFMWNGVYGIGTSYGGVCTTCSAASREVHLPSLPAGGVCPGFGFGGGAVASATSTVTGNIFSGS